MPDNPEQLKPATGCAAGILIAAALWALAGCALIDCIGSHELPTVDPPGQTEPAPEPEASAADQVDYAALQWTCGGFAGGSAERCNGVAIADLRVTASGMSSANSHENADCIAAVFVRVAGAWQGGKMDWISSDRLTRDWHNVRGGYKGWSGGLLDSADAFAFVIVSSDGRRRTNVILSEGGLP